MSELLLELGTEELPAHSVRRAYRDLAEKLESVLIHEGLLGPQSEPISMGTPRRLIVSIPNIKDRQTDSSKEQRGPGLKAAYDADGKPTPALLGFCRGQGVELGDLRNDGQYIWLTKKIEGRSAGDILREAIPSAIRGLTFDKTMRWGSGKMRFARPIRWILATLDSEIVPFEIEGVKTSNLSRGHRFYSPHPFPAGNLAELVSGLRERNVEPDPDSRRRMILENLSVGTKEHPVLPESLIEENIFLTEWPTPIVGEFNPEFLSLPSAVLSTVMAKHEKMFPILDGKKQITNRFIFVRNSGVDESVRKGCEWVLNARMNDAKFFFDEDCRFTLDDFLLKTKGILFQEKLGTVFSRSERLSRMAPIVCPNPNESPSEAEFAAEAGKFAKADLATGLVSELASLQGVIGGNYAQSAGLADEVCWAISTQYDPSLNPIPKDSKSRTAIRLLIADQLDKLVGYLGAGFEPSGSSDPYGLRRAVSVLIEAAWSWPVPLRPYSELFVEAEKLYREQRIPIDMDGGLAAFGRLFAARYPALLPGVRHDIIESALLSEDLSALTSPQRVRFRVALMEALSEDQAFVQTATRPINIVASAQKKGFEVSGDLNLVEVDALDSSAGFLLMVKAKNLGVFLRDAVEQRDLSRSLDLLRELQSPINAFFESTMVMVEDSRTREARLNLLGGVSALLALSGDFTKLVFEGSR